MHLAAGERAGERGAIGARTHAPIDLGVGDARAARLEHFLEPLAAALAAKHDDVLTLHGLQARQREQRIAVVALVG